MYNYFCFLYLQPASLILPAYNDDEHPLEETESEMDMSGPFNSDTDHYVLCIMYLIISLL